jgi:predicted lipid-binding transport protein (Tim44 family)
MVTLFFAALTFIIFLKLGSQLGKVDEEEKSQIEAKIAKKRAEIAAIQNQVIERITEISSEQSKAEEELLKDLGSAIKKNLLEIFQRCNISTSFFLNGAKSSFEMVLKAFASSDLETLKMLLSENIYKGFESSIEARKTKEQTLITNLILVEKTEIIAANLSEKIASVVVKFSSKQINYILNKDNVVIEGKKDEINHLIDIWTFKKDISSPNPNWAISNTAQ